MIAIDKVDIAVKRIQAAAQMSEQFYGQPLIVTDSGGKDSSVCKRLAEIAGIKYEVMHNHTTADAPETVFFVRDEFKRLESAGVKCILNKPTYKGKRVSMWTLIPQKLMPPTRIVRYCCDVLKEGGGAGRFITTGVRWDESTKRKNTRGIFENISKDKEKRIILNNDNDDTRRLFETCSIKAKRVCNPIIDWTDSEVWDFLLAEHVPMNPLYSRGFRRVGCIGCPMTGKRRYEGFRIYPKYKNCYIMAFGWMVDARKQKGLETKWGSGEEVFHWWMEDGVLPGQTKLDV